MKKNKIISLLLSLLIAAGLWVYVVSAVTPEDNQWIYNIPVTFINEDGLFSDRNLMLTDGRDAVVSLRFNGNRQDLMKLNNTNVIVSVDLSRVTGPGNWNLSYDFELPDTVSSNSISLVGRTKPTVDIVVDKLSVKEIPVRAIFVGNVASDYVQEPIKPEYETIEISGPEELVGGVEYAQVTLERTNLSKTVSDVLPVTLMDAEDKPVESGEIKCSVDEIGVEMPVHMLKEVPLTATLISGGGASADHAVLTIEPKTVMIKGNPEDLEVLNSINIGAIDLASVQKVQSKEFEIVIPDGMSNLTGDTATATVELKNLKTKTFQVTNIECSNKPENYSVTLGTSSLQVQVRGVAEEVNELTAGNIRAVADLAAINGSTGQYLVSVEILIDGFDDVGAMGSYNVLVTISETVTQEDAVEITQQTAAMINFGTDEAESSESKE